MTRVPVYTALANVYDEVMKNVSYAAWTEYLDELIRKHHPEPVDLLELACGTGTMAIEMSHLDHYTILATDRSPQMVETAREKAAAIGVSVKFEVMDFLNITTDRTFDVIYMAFDSLNYLHRKSEILELHRQVFHILKPGGLFIYDFTTPRNSQKAIRYLNNVSGETESWEFSRMSQYDHDHRIHTNTFVITQTHSASSMLSDDVVYEDTGDADERTSGAKTAENHATGNHPANDHASEGHHASQIRFKENGAQLRRFTEVHRQKIYTLEEIEAILKETDFQLLEAYDGFTTNPAGKKSLRVTVVLRAEKAGGKS